MANFKSTCEHLAALSVIFFIYARYIRSIPLVIQLQPRELCHYWLYKYLQTNPILLSCYKQGYFIYQSINEQSRYEITNNLYRKLFPDYIFHQTQKHLIIICLVASTQPNVGQKVIHWHKLAVSLQLTRNVTANTFSRISCNNHSSSCRSVRTNISGADSDKIANFSSVGGYIVAHNVAGILVVA